MVREQCSEQIEIKTKKNKSIDKREGGDQRNEGGRERTVVLTTKLGISTSSHMLRGQVAPTGSFLPSFTSSAKPRGHLHAHTGPKGFEHGPMLWRLKHFTSWTSAAWRLLEKVEGIYIPIHCFIFLFYLSIYDWKKEITSFGEASR